MLEVKNLCVNYGYIQALKDVSVSAKEGEIVSIIGSNGAGKSSLLKTISGLVKPVSGTIEFQGSPIPNKPHEIVKKGIIHVPEGRRTFSGLTVKENLLVGGYLSDQKKLEEKMRKYYKRFPILKERENQHAGTLSGGEQQMLAITRGLMSNPKILLLDEPSLGLAPLIVREIFCIIQEIRDSGVTILLVEQNARRALGICDRAYVLENGKIMVSGTGKELLESDVVKKAYLGA